MASATSTERAREPLAPDRGAEIAGGATAVIGGTIVPGVIGAQDRVSDGRVALDAEGDSDVVGPSADFPEVPSRVGVVVAG
jgi:hypothetical protein